MTAATEYRCSVLCFVLHYMDPLKSKEKSVQLQAFRCSGVEKVKLHKSNNLTSEQINHHIYNFIGAHFLRIPFFSSDTRPFSNRTTLSTESSNSSVC